MNEEIRAAVNARLKEKGLSRADLARAVDAHPNAITRALNDTGGRGGSIPPLWAAILEALDLRLTVEPGQGSKTGEEGQA
ncbi:helix-turn-helix transcriptional regulator [Deinococcus sp. JMULE3]|uniref:helix-turn-helix domain-containing protein n=1 Tax=Deinococcus sp. JMULE3 TaxID=2518341 RepID=UPI001575DF8B|nr:helix-turn-helix transcriptional regulator [Deinococcus sp. JMULE3]NTY02118.1 XRE family transcriptional regulator [Deinococcus sp. JMULE3]